MLRSLRTIGFALALAAMPAAASADQILVFAAASLKTALDTVATGFARETGHGVTVSYGGSSALARQIQFGAPADVFISANEGWMDELEKTGLIDAGSRRDLLGNTLVLIASDPAERPVELGPQTDLLAMLAGGRLAMGLVDAVPAGIYGKAALENLGLWSSVAGQVAQTENVRAALALVATGEAPFGIVYGTDARADPRVHRVATFPAESHPPITYPAAVLAGHDSDAVRAFLDYLGSAPARAVFEAEGFDVLASGG